jgi:hypothetical protein
VKHRDARVGATRKEDAFLRSDKPHWITKGPESVEFSENPVFLPAPSERSLGVNNREGKEMR